VNRVAKQRHQNGSPRKALPNSLTCWTTRKPNEDDEPYLGPVYTYDPDLSPHTEVLYEYKPLRLPQSQIRLATIIPGFWDDPIKLYVVHVNLSDEIPYEALSYTWGDPSVTVPIFINGYTFQVTTNLASALRHLRDKRQDRALWVDAICINQSDIAETREQVARMRDIYALADRAVAWLGPAADDSDFAMDILADHKTRNQRFYRWKVPRVGPEDPYFASALFNRSYSALLSLFSRHWWRRAWIIQEVATQRPLELVCGFKAVSWDFCWTFVWIWGSTLEQVAFSWAPIPGA
jgi:hypothetical protein